MLYPSTTDTLIESIASDEVIEQAYLWLCRQRRDYHHHNNDVWHLRRWWDEKKPYIQSKLKSGNYRFREQRVIRASVGRIELWSAMDALGLLTMSLVLTSTLQLELSPRVYHLAGTGGRKAAVSVRVVADCLADYKFVFRTEVIGYYASINP